jgi:hypothetical protein
VSEKEKLENEKKKEVVVVEEEGHKAVATDV